MWHEGVDVTAEPPETWGPPWSWYVDELRGVEARDYWLRQHGEAAGHEGHEYGDHS